ncbi:MAG: site-2 protease family protein [Acidobacteria bacterium]|nr:site-2 protease family protein [Acidobacteriota bacterium]
MKLPFFSKPQEKSFEQEENNRFFYSNDESATSYVLSLNSGLGVTPRQFIFHLFLFIATVVTTTISGAIFPYLLQELEIEEVIRILTSSWVPITNGLLFSFTLLTILFTHELGHYIACRYYGVVATLPYFIPIPPPLGIGTLGAFIKIQSPIYTRKALFDIGISGPLAGFVFAIPAAIAGIYNAKPITDSALAINFNSPLLFTLISKAFGIESHLAWNPIWFACWVGLLATALNLLPVGQLDGGHVVYALFGRKGHRSVALVVTLAQAMIAYFAYIDSNWSGGFIYAIVLVVMFVMRHPQVVDEDEPLGIWRKILAFIALIVFILSFMPVPLKIN